MSSKIAWLNTPKEIDHKLWSGSITLNRPDAKNIDKYKQTISESYTATKDGAPIRCIDGRPAEAKVAPLGPETAGGSPGIALAELVTLHKKQTVVESLNELVQHGLSHFEHGAHIDAHTGDQNCGCGAVDKMADIIAKIQNYGQDIEPVVEAIMDSDFDAKAYSVVVKSFSTLSTSKLLPEGYRQEVIRITGRNDGAIEKVVGTHNEVAIVVNKTPNTTLDKDELSHSTDDQVEAFGFDYWFAKEYAGKNIDLLTALTIYQVAAAMVLTDGTLAVGIRQ